MILPLMLPFDESDFEEKREVVHKVAAQTLAAMWGEEWGGQYVNCGPDSLEVHPEFSTYSVSLT